MTPIRQFFGQAQIYVILLSSFAFATLQNVTIDDAVLVGAVVPQYLPSASSWNQGNNCLQCLVKPDPSQAYNSTWHDATFQPNSGISPAIQFSFVGSALYIFFILANTVSFASTLTDVVFYLDETAVGTFVHPPSTSTDYQYHVPVYVNESLPFGEHNMMMEPVNSGNSVLMLFDYLVYTTDMDNATTSSSISPSASAVPSLASQVTQSTASGQNIAAIVGGSLGGVAALLLVIGSLLCYRRYRKPRRLSLQKGDVLESLVSLDAVAPAPTPFVGIPPGAFHMESRLSKPQRNSTRSPTTLRPPSPPISIYPPSTASLFNNNAAVLEQVEILRDEVSRLRHLQMHNQKTTTLGTKG